MVPPKHLLHLCANDCHMSQPDESDSPKNRSRNVSRRNVLRTTGAVAGIGSVVGLAGCNGVLNGGSGSSNDQANTENQDTSELPEVEAQIAHHMEPSPIAHPHQAAVEFKERMESWTDGRFSVEVVPGGALGTEGEVLEQNIDGSLEMSTAIAEGALAPFYPNINVIGIPYMFRNVREANAVFDGEYGQRLFDDMRQETSLRVLSFWENGGFRTFSTTDTPINGPDDFNGLTIRTMEIEAHQEMVRALGAEPEPIPGDELYNALEQGIVDGQENSIPTMVQSRRYEVQGYFIMDKHLYSQNYLIASDDWYQDLHPTYQTMVDHASTHASRVARRICRIGRQEGRAFIESEGPEFIDVSNEQKQEYADITQEPTLEIIRENVNDEQWIEDLYDARDEIRNQQQYPPEGF